MPAAPATVHGPLRAVQPGIDRSCSPDVRNVRFAHRVVGGQVIIIRGNCWGNVEQLKRTLDEDGRL